MLYLPGAQYALYERHLRQQRHQIELTMIFAGEEDVLTPGEVLGPVIRDCFVIEYCKVGGGTMIADGVRRTVCAGEVFVLFPWSTVTLIASEDQPWAKAWGCLWGSRVNGDLKGMGVTPENPILPVRDNPGLLALMQELAQLYRQNPDLTEFEQNICANRLLLALWSLCGGSASGRAAPNQQEQYVNKALRYIEQNFSHPIQVSDLAAHVNLDRAYFSNLFKRHTGVSPARYLTDYRMKKACEFLQNPHASVSSVARSIGYEPQNFSRLFRQVKGVSPQAYRQSLI